MAGDLNCFQCAFCGAMVLQENSPSLCGNPECISFNNPEMSADDIIWADCSGCLPPDL